MPPQLNRDTLILVLSMLDTRSLPAAMRASRWFYTEAAKTLVKGPLFLTIEDEDVLESFLLFANAEDGRRLPLFQSLNVAFCEIELEQDMKDSFAECVRAMVGLRRLALSWAECVSENLEDHPALADAVSALTNLEDLCLDQCHLEENTAAFIRGLESELRIIKLRVQDSSAVDLYEENDPVVLLSHMSSCLEVMATTGWTHVQDSEDYTEYPKVHSLTIDYVRSPITARYARAFPNLTSLSLKTTESFGAELDELLDCRSLNLQQGGEQYWPSLKAFSGFIDDAYILALGPRTLDRLELYVMDNELSRLTDVLCDIAPTHLSILNEQPGSDDLRLREGNNATVADALRRGSGAASVRTLRIGFGPHEYEGWDALVWTFEEIIDAMRPLQIEEFVWETRPQRDTLSVHPCFAKGRKQDFPKYILGCVPSLREVRIVRKDWGEREGFWDVIKVTRADL